MNLIVVGCGRVGSELAYRLYQKGHRVTVVDPLEAAFDNLPPGFQGRTIAGDVLNQDVLHRAGIQHADGLAAVTNSDSLNAVIARVAQVVYQVPNVVARNYDPRWRPVHEAFGLQVVSSASWGAQRLEDLLCQSGTDAILTPGSGEVAVLELVLPESWHGRRLHELLAGAECLPVALTRAGQATLPGPDTRVEAGDLLYVSATAAGRAVVQARLAPPEEG